MKPFRAKPFKAKPFKDIKLSDEIKTTCAPCMSNNHGNCIPVSPLKHVECLCAWYGHRVD